MTDTVTRTLVEQIVDGKRLGRHVEHDPRSRGYAFKAAEDVALRNIVHRHYGGVLDQGNLGSCTGNACAGAINTIPIHAKREHVLREPEALDLYELATAIDEFPGQYPPEDTGSSGLAVAKAAQQKGYISSYQHAFSIGDALAGAHGGSHHRGRQLVRGVRCTRMLTASSRSRGLIRGGHEFVVRGFHKHQRVSDSLLVADNSWGPGWGERGRFLFTVSTLNRLLNEDGDATILVP
jgi:hypothetical protein